MRIQLRVVRAFKSILEDLEEKRSTHSIHCLRTSRSHPVMSQTSRQLSEAAYINEADNKAGGYHNSSHNNMIMLV